MPSNHRPVLRFLYVLLFFSFVGMSLGQPIGTWISATFGGWATVEALAAYAAYVAGLIWLINRINKAARFEVPATSSSPMTEIDFIRREVRAAEYSEGRSAEAPLEPGAGTEPRLGRASTDPGK